MNVSLALRASMKYLLGVGVVALLIFLPAGSLGYWQGWLLMATLFVPILIAGVVMLIKSPALLESRLKAKEGQREQDVVVKLSGLLFVAAFVEKALLVFNNQVLAVSPYLVNIVNEIYGLKCMVAIHAV